MRLALGWLIALMWSASATSAQTWTADNGNGTFSNPLFFDEFSDPDLIRVGSDFYMTGTTMHSMPGLPILHSRDLVNWRFLGYALDRLDLGPEFRLEDGKAVYGQGIWAPSFRYHMGTFYIFSNVNNHTTQVFRATNPAGPWTRTPMKRSLHDIAVLFDDDGRVYAIWGYRGIRLAELTPDLLDIVPGTEREIIPASAGMGEGVHAYQIRGKYYLTSAWFTGEMRLPTARADRLGRTVGGESGCQPRRGLRFCRGLSDGAVSTAAVHSTAAQPRSNRQKRHPSGGHRRDTGRRVVGLLDDGRELRRTSDGALPGDVEGRLAVLRPAEQPRTLAAHLGEAADRCDRCARRSLSAQRRFREVLAAADLAVEPRARGRTVVVVGATGVSAAPRSAGGRSPRGPQHAHAAIDWTRVRLRQWCWTSQGCGPETSPGSRCSIARTRGSACQWTSAAGR